MGISDNPNYDASGTDVARIIHVQGTGISDKWRSRARDWRLRIQRDSPKPG